MTKFYALLRYQTLVTNYRVFLVILEIELELLQSPYIISYIILITDVCLYFLIDLYKDEEIRQDANIFDHDWLGV